MPRVHVRIVLPQTEKSKDPARGVPQNRLPFTHMYISPYAPLPALPPCAILINNYVSICTGGHPPCIRNSKCTSPPCPNFKNIYSMWGSGNLKFTYNFLIIYIQFTNVVHNIKQSVRVSTDKSFDPWFNFLTSPDLN